MSRSDANLRTSQPRSGRAKHRLWRCLRLSAAWTLLLVAALLLRDFWLPVPAGYTYEVIRFWAHGAPASEAVVIVDRVGASCSCEEHRRRPGQAVDCRHIKALRAAELVDVPFACCEGEIDPCRSCLEEKARALGTEHYTVDAKAEFVTDYCWPAVRATSSSDTRSVTSSDTRESTNRRAL